MVVEGDVTVAEIVRLIADIKAVAISDISADTLLFSEDAGVPSLDFDSLDAFELVVAIENAFDIELRGEDVDDLFDMRALQTVAGVSDYVTSVIARQR